MIKSTKIRKQLKRFFPFWKPANIIITDTEYNNISIEVLQDEVINIPAEGDCDDYTRELWCYLRHLHPQDPIGICLLSKSGGLRTNHAMIVCSCDEGIAIVEPQAVWGIGIAGMEKVWLADNKKEQFYFVYI